MGIVNLYAGFIILVMGLCIDISAKSNFSLEKKSEKYDKVKQARFGCKVLITSSAILIISGLAYMIAMIPTYMIVISWILYLFVIIGGIVYSYKGDRFKRR